MKNKIDWSKSPNGVMLCSFEKAMDLMPECTPVLLELLDSGLLELPAEEYAVDVKVHMLMPNQYPCIPNWHFDFMPRNEEGKRVPAKASPLKMYEWVSGTPFTEFKDSHGNSKFITPLEWHSFTQLDLHRGTKSDKFTWRCFIRVIPKSFIHPNSITNARRIHTQVYLDAEKFSW